LAGKSKESSHVSQPCETVKEIRCLLPHGELLLGLVGRKQEETVCPGEGRCPGERLKVGKGGIKVSQGGAFVGKWREVRGKQGWLQVSWLLGSVLPWLNPAPDGHSLSCRLLKLCVALVGGVCAYSLLSGCVWEASPCPMVSQIWLCVIYPAPTGCQVAEQRSSMQRPKPCISSHPLWGSGRELEGVKGERL